MNKNLKERLERMTQEEHEERFRELGEKLGLRNPPLLGTEPPPPSSLDDLCEYNELKRMLGYSG